MRKPDGPEDPAPNGDAAPQPGERLETVRVPEAFHDIFLRAQRHVAAYFANRIENPKLSTISIAGERYILVRAASMSVEFFDLVISLYKDRGPLEARNVASNLLFDLAHAIGKADAKTFHERMGVTDPVEKLSAGPIHFSFSGWASVEIFPESRPSPDENFYLVYDHPFSFESDSWIKRKKTSDFPVCVMNAGYSSGWCEESFGLPLVAVEIECLASGGDHCRFIMAPPARIEQHVEEHATRHGVPSRHLVSRAAVTVPEFFQRKRMEEELQRSRDELEVRVEERTVELVTEIAERTAVEKQLRLLESAVENAIEGILLLTPRDEMGEHRIIFANRGFETLTGYGAGDVIGKTLEALHLAEEEREVRRRLTTHLEKQIAFEAEAAATRKDGSQYVLELHVMPVREQGGNVTHWACILRDVSDRKAHLAALEHQALHDMLTGLPNRVLLLDRLEQALLSSTRANNPLALFILDLDRFKEVNDAFGHHVGDQLLVQVGPRLKGQLRSSDTVARLGGDEFAVLMPSVDDADTSKTMAEKLVKALETPFVVESQAFNVGASLGIALSPDHGLDAATLLRRADVAMYIAKQSNSGIALYSAEQDTNTPSLLALVGDLREAIEQRRLLLHYQPKVSLADGTVRGVEALVRWPHPREGMLPPDAFNPLAERTGLITSLTAWVLNEALAQCRAWQDEGLPLDIAVNLSGRCLHEATLVDLVREALGRWRVEPQRLTFELTETTVMSDPDHARVVLSELRALGVRLSIDDFGTGYSSLSHLRLLPVDEIKIDRSFVCDMLRSAPDEAIVHSTIQLCQNLGRLVVAEGVEDAATLERLRQLGCDAAQGYHIAKPLAAAALTEWMKAGH